ncbi:taste receptor type 2 member 40-like [Spea bombifrons]|uniref:taste receptor type 2 member 40-like n=1 Tax=Spea bombifrons TaxID=233779 RepID=UPI00234A838A|nr:taste receptor type 2 member 40-like [Spea bombifrons]
MLPVFIIASMAIVTLSTLVGVFTNTLIIAVNLMDKAKGKSLGSSDLILVTLGASNVLFQFTMLANDFVSFLYTDLYFSDQVYITFTVLLILPIYSSFWFTVCLSVYYCLQIVIFTHPFLIRLKMGLSQLIPQLLIVSVFTSVTTGLPSAWNVYRDAQDLNTSTNESTEISVPKLNIVYLLPTNIISCSLPLVLVGIADGLIIKSLVAHRYKADRNAKGVPSARAEGRVRAARTISCLLFLYMSFYISEILMFIDAFPPSSPGFCACLMVIYSYSPAQSIVLILGSPKLKQVSLSLLRRTGGMNRKRSKTTNVLFINPIFKKETLQTTK